MELKALTRHLQSSNRQRRLHCVSPFVLPQVEAHKGFYSSKVWDTYTGEALHSFPHNHIVRSVDISPVATQIATGDQEKKIRIFDLNRPDADPRFLTPKGKDFAHEKTVRSVVWLLDSNIIVSGGEDGAVQ